MSNIEWTEKTWNPVTGCTKISAGCKYCYAETLSKRLKAMGVNGYQDGFAITCHEDRLNQPLKRKIPTMYFVNSMSDLFHPRVPFDFINKVMETIRKSPQHTYQILTKRPKVMQKYFATRDVPKNAWLGVSVENKKHGVPRIDVLRKINAKTRFLSVEPLLEDIGKVDLSDIHWVIVGGESGNKARLMDSTWIDNIYRQCQSHRVAFFFKQWGTWGADRIKRNKKANGRTYQGKTWDAMPQQVIACSY